MGAGLSSCSTITITSTYLPFTVLSMDFHKVINNLHTQVFRREVFYIQHDCELVPIRPHLKRALSHSEARALGVGAAATPSQIKGQKRGGLALCPSVTMSLSRGLLPIVGTQGH